MENILVKEDKSLILYSKQTKSKKINNFLSKNDFFNINVKKLTQALLFDMNNGLQKNLGTNKSIQPMIVATNKIPEMIPVNSTSIIIDAGGTNFRSCLVNILPSGEYIISEMIKTKMPATDKELTKDQFYDAIAANLDHLKNKATRIGFCFSYAMEITTDGDGKILAFSKEIKAPQAIGTYVGAELKETLIKRGWKNIEKISILNDTTACLLGGILHSQKNKLNFSSYIGFILGTGINNAYIEYNPIQKVEDNSKSHIIVCECGMYNKIPSSKIDVSIDKNSTTPGKSLLEKKCSGAYLGKIAFETIKEAAKENLFTKNFANELEKIENINLKDIDIFYKNKNDQNSILNKLRKYSTKKDIRTLKTIIDFIIERSSNIVASVISASIIKSQKGMEKKSPICIVGNGTTFWKTHNLYKKINKSLKTELTKKNKRYYKIVNIKDDITLGTCAAAFI